MTDTAAAKVAIIGAGGIGKHHAKWWSLEGARVCAIAGTSPESLARAEEGLRSLLPYDGRSYTDVARLLEQERPDIVDVCSPHHLHYAHTRQALEAGCHVLCEKPFVYDRALPPAELMRQTRELTAHAVQRSLRLGICTQYAVGAGLFLEVWRERFGDEPIVRFSGHLEAPAKGRGPDPHRVWVDLAPHPLSVLQKLAPGFHLSDLRVGFDGYEATARFRLSAQEGRGTVPDLECEVLTRNSVDPPQNVREFRFNDYLFRVEGVADEQGTYCAQIVTPDGEHIRPDMMRLTVRAFLRGDTAAMGDPEMNMLLLLEGLQAADKA